MFDAWTLVIFTISHCLFLCCILSHPIGMMAEVVEEAHRETGDLNRSAFIANLECSLCLSLICEPITTACGHSFCRVCLVKSLSRHKKKCPTCREVCHISAENAAENIMIKNIAMALDSALYAARLVEFQAEKRTWNTLYPIFYYNSAMFPGSRLSLHLFEPRYKLMMQRVVNSSRAFAFVPNFSTYHASIGDIALVAELKDVEFLAGNALHCFTSQYVELTL